MTVQEVLRETQGRDTGVVNRASVNYAETLIGPDDAVIAAVVANIKTRREHFPGVVVLTDRRVLATCSLPGIKRSISLCLDELNYEETSSFLNYKAEFSTKEEGFSLTVNPEIGERFSRCLAVLRGEAEEFDAVNEAGKSSILSPTLVRNILRQRRARKKEIDRRKIRQEEADRRFAAELEADSHPINAGKEDAEAVAKRLNQRLEQTKQQRSVADTDPLAVAARLAEELAGKSGDEPE